ncbi:MAG: DUF58 domain-containing protein [Planctomycetota bacterium]
MVVQGFLQGLHGSPFQGFSVQFADHRRYNRGDDPRLIDWLVYAKTDKYFIKRFEAETNITGYLAIDTSASMGVHSSLAGHTDTDTMTKFEYCTCLAAALTYLMTLQQDPVGLVALGERMRALLPPRSRRGHLSEVVAAISRLEPKGTVDLVGGLSRLSAMMGKNSLVMVFSDLMPSGDQADDVEKHLDETISALSRLKHGGNDVIVFHVLDEAEVNFPFEGPITFEDAESGEAITVDASGFRDVYLDQLRHFRESLVSRCGDLNIDLVLLHTGMAFDTALTEYLLERQRSG